MARGYTVAEILLPGRPIGKKMLAGDAVAEMLLAGGAAAKSHREDATDRGADVDWQTVEGPALATMASAEMPAPKR